MTPTEKAKEIYDRFRIDPVCKQKRGSHLDAIEYSIILIMEIIDECADQENRDRFDFWQEVLNEIKSVE